MRAGYDECVLAVVASGQFRTRDCTNLDAFLAVNTQVGQTKQRLGAYAEKIEIIKQKN